ncbi:hypothetical protein [Mycolicibacterium sp. XJ1819]
MTFDPRTLLAQSRLGVLAAIKADGMPQLSPVTPYYDRDADNRTVMVADRRVLMTMAVRHVYGEKLR